MDLITEEVEKKIAFILPSKIVIVIDGWTKQSTHFLGVFATFPVQNELGYESVLLSFSPMAIETSFKGRSCSFKMFRRAATIDCHCQFLL